MSICPNCISTDTEAAPWSLWDWFAALYLLPFSLVLLLVKGERCCRRCGCRFKE